MERNVSNFPLLQQLSDRSRATVTEQLGEDLFTAAYQRGRALPLGEAVALASGQG